jgi:hypothetical protein
MAITQLSVFLENKPGQLARAVKIISNGGVNIRALSLADTRDFGILRLIVSDIKKAKELLQELSIVTETPVIAVRMDDQAGALTDVLQALNRANVNVEYVYAFTGSAALSAYVVFRVDDVPHAETVLREAGIPTLDDETILKLL